MKYCTRATQKKRHVTLYVSIDNKQHRATAVTVAESEDNMRYIVVANNGQTLIRNLNKEEAVVFAMNMKERYPENNFYVRKQDC